MDTSTPILTNLDKTCVQTSKEVFEPPPQTDEKIIMKQKMIETIETAQETFPNRVEGIGIRMKESERGVIKEEHGEGSVIKQEINNVTFLNEDNEDGTKQDKEKKKVKENDDEVAELISKETTEEG